METIVNGTHLRNALGALGLSQIKAADWLSVDARTLRRWVADEAPIPGPVEAAVKAWLSVDRQQFRFKANAYVHGVPWFQEEGIYDGEFVPMTSIRVRIYAPDADDQPPSIEVPYSMVERFEGGSAYTLYFVGDHPNERNVYLIVVFEGRIAGSGEALVYVVAADDDHVPPGHFVAQSGGRDAAMQIATRALRKLPQNRGRRLKHDGPRPVPRTTVV